MAYQTGRIGKATIVAVKNAARPAYLRRLAKASLDWEFERLASRLQLVSLASVCTDQYQIALPLGPSTWGETPIIDLVALCALVHRSKPMQAFEFGTFTGNATLAIAMNASPHAKIYTLDLPPEKRSQTEGLNWEATIDDQIIGRQFHNTEFAPRITQLLADSRTYDTAPLRNSIDFVWIDACHEYEFVKNDSEKALELSRPGAILAWHDVSRACPGVLQYLVELAGSRTINRIDGTQVAYCQTSVAPAC